MKYCVSFDIQLLFFVKTVCCQWEPSKQLFLNDPTGKTQVDLSWVSHDCELSPPIQLYDLQLILNQLQLTQ